MKLIKRLTDYWWILAALILYLPLTFQGYGADNDTYRVLNIGRHLVNTGDYGPSRQPGYPVHEMAVLLLDKAGRGIYPDGGSFFTNLGSLIMALISLGAFSVICKIYRLNSHHVLLAIMLVFPIFWINASSTIDFVWALGFLLAGFVFLLRSKYTLAGLCLGLAIGTRLTTVIAVSGVILLAAISNPNGRKQTLFTGLGAFILGGLCYIPSFIFARYSFGFLAIATGEQDLWTGYLRIGRFIYKNIYFWGLLPAVYLLYLSVLVCLKWKNNKLDKKMLAVTSMATILAYEVLFFRYPIEADYLLTTLPFWLLLLGIYLGDRPKLLAGLCFLLFISNFISINIARPDTPNQATGVTFGLWLERGPLLNDIEIRQRLFPCDHIECYKILINP